MKTTRDWIHASKRRAADAAACLRAGEEAVRHASDWIDLAGRWVELAELPSARRCVDACLRVAGHDLWPCRHAAELLVGPLADRPAAERALAQVEDGLRPERLAHVSRWTWLAQTYRIVLADEAGVARCMGEAARRALEARDLSELAEGVLTVDQDRDAARAILARAEETVRRTGAWRDVWDIANKWKSEAFADDARARAALELGTGGATDPRDLTALATAWRCLFADEAGIRGALARAESSTAGCEGWIRMAEGFHDGGENARADAWDPAGVRRCLEAAVAAGPTEEQRFRISRGFRHQLNDPARAGEISPAGLVPEERTPSPVPLPGDPRALLRVLRGRMSAASIKKIATNDYGFDWIKHHQALEDIVRTGLVPLPLEWVPMETLGLARWHRGDDTDHVGRAFASLLLAYDFVVDNDRQWGEVQDSLAPLLESAWILGLDRELEDWLAWFVEVLDPERSPVAWALLASILAIARRAPADPRLAALIERLEARVARMSTWGDDASWLYGTTNYNQSYDQWRALVAETLAPARELPPDLRRLAGRLAPTSREGPS